MPDRFNQERVKVDEALALLLEEFHSGNNMFSAEVDCTAWTAVFCHYRPGLDTYLFQRSAAPVNWAIYLKPYSGDADRPVLFHVRFGRDTLDFTEPLDTTIAALKSKVSAHVGIGLPPLLQKWIYNGRILADSMALVACGVKEGDTIQVIQVTSYDFT